MGKYFVIFALLVSAIVALIYQASERAVHVKPFSEEVQLERLRLQRTHPISFPKGFIALTEVRKHPELQNESEVEAYFYRYNQAAAGYHQKNTKKASENLEKFRSYQKILGNTRYLEIMNLADKDYPFQPDKTD